MARRNRGASMKRLIIAALITVFVLTCSPLYAQVFRGVHAGIVGAAAGESVANPMKQKIFSGSATALSNAAARYLTVMGGATPSNTEAYRTEIAPVSGTFRKLRVSLSAAPDNGAGTQSYVIALRKNGSTQALTCTVSEANTTCQDESNSFTVAAGDRISILATPSGTPVAAAMITQVEFQGDSANQSVLLSSSGDAMSDSATRYFPVSGSSAISLEYSVHSVMPLSGTITAFYGYLTAAPGASGSRTISIRKNGSTEATSTLSFGETDVTKNATGLSIAVSAGDRLSIISEVSGTPTAANGHFGILFTPTTNGEFPILQAGAATSFPAGSTRYLPQSGYVDIRETEDYFSLGYNDYAIKAIYAYTNAAPGSGNSLTFTPRKANSGSPVDSTPPNAFTISNTNQSGSSTGDLTPTQWEGYGTKIESSASLSILRITIGYKGYITP